MPLSTLNAQTENAVVETGKEKIAAALEAFVNRRSDRDA